MAIVPAATAAQELPGIALLQDAQGAFAQAYGGQQASFLVRPDGFVAWRSTGPVADAEATLQEVLTSLLHRS